MEEVTGFRTSILYQNEVTGYSVIRIKIDDGQEEKLTVVGYFPIPEPYELYRYFGKIIEHNRFGRQFEVTSFERIDPKDKEAIIRFLSSTKFSGVGKSLAGKIYEQLGVDCLETIRKCPEVLETIEGIKPYQISTIVKGVIETENTVEDAVKIFVQHGLSLKDILKLQAIYKKEMIETVLSDPYRIIKDIDINFKAIDKIALSLGVSRLDSKRIRAAILYAINLACQNSGDSYTDKRTIYRYTYRLLESINSQDFDDNFNLLIDCNEVIVYENRVHSLTLYNAEIGIAEYLSPFIHQRFEVEEEIILSKIKQIEEEIGIEYSQEQKNAIISVFKKGINLITGGPGVGKTTIIKAIVEVYKRLFPNKSVHLCAPTGRAAKRLSEVTNKQATTIHRFLGWDLHTNKFYFNEFNPISGDFIIIDEFSMVDTELFYHLLTAINGFERILIIGDDQQLPSVMPGNMLYDLTMVNKINKYNLSQIFRQSENSSIIQLAYEIRAGFVDKKDFYQDDARFHQLNSQSAREEIVRLVNSYKDIGYAELDIQVIAPMYLGVCGIDNLNETIRNIFNPHDQDKKELSVGTRLFRVGDKVLQLKNEPDNDVYNGDIGFIKEIILKGESGSRKNIILVDFDNNIVEYDHNNFYHLTHAYCISVHKSQGSEYPVVIMPVVAEHQKMLKRKLIYTGITRAKKHLEIVGQFECLSQGVVENEKIRNTTIAEKFLGKLI